MTKAIMDEFVQECLLPSVPDSAMVLLDCWSGQTSVDELIQPEGKDVQFRFIPPGTTGIIQPLDVYGFR